MGERRAYETIDTARWTENPGTTRREVIFRRTVIIAMAALVGAAALGVLGPRAATQRVEDGLGVMEVTYPRVTRPGLYVDVQVELARTDVESAAFLTVPQEALALFDVDSITPEPVRQVSRDGAVRYEFALSRDERVTLTFTGRVPVKGGPRRTAWWIEWGAEGAGAAPARAEMTTWVLP